MRKVSYNNELLTMATKDVRKDTRTAKEAKPKTMKFAFDKKNYMFLIIGIVLLIIGYVALSGGGTNDPNKFSEALFSTRRMVIAPIILFLGYCTIAYGIMIKPKAKQDNGSQQ